MEEMEKLLRVWMQDQHQCQILLSSMLIQESLQSLYEGLKKKQAKKQRAIPQCQPWFKATASLTTEKWWRPWSADMVAGLGTSETPWRNYCTVLY